MYAFGEIDKTSTIIKNNVVNYNQNLNTSSLGIQSIKIVSGSINTNYWNSLNTLQVVHLFIQMGLNLFFQINQVIYL